MTEEEWESMVGGKEMKLFNLSDYVGDWQEPNIHFNEVKIFIRLIKENTHFENYKDQEEWENMIDDYAGEMFK